MSIREVLALSLRKRRRPVAYRRNSWRTAQDRPSLHQLIIALSFGSSGASTLECRLFGAQLTAFTHGQLSTGLRDLTLGHMANRWNWHFPQAA
jgi:hypothetical protein